MLISVHLPKAAGSSLELSLRDHFGEGLVRVHDRPIHMPPLRRNLRAAGLCVVNAFQRFPGLACIHGHFLPLKYLSLRYTRGAKFVTWLRDPAQRLVSHYHYFVRTYAPETQSQLQKKVVEENWSLEQFCLCPDLKNFYCQFLWGFPLRCFDFIGFVEHFDEDFEIFTRRFLGAELPSYRDNVNADRKDRIYPVDAALQPKLEAFHSRDFDLYRTLLARRAAWRAAGR